MASGKVRLFLRLSSLLLVGWANAAVNLEDPCDDTKKCEIIGAACNNENKCMCLDEYIQSTDKKECKQELIGGVCLENSQCPATSTCEGADGVKTCTCEDQYVPNTDNKTCLPVATAINGACQIDAQCYTPFANSECGGRNCKCLDTHVTSSARDKCLEKMYIDENCTESQQCADLILGDCIGGICKCKDEDDHFVFQRCWKGVKLGQSCKDEAECILSDGNLGDVECFKGNCTCILNYEPNEESNKCSSGVTNTVAVISMAFVLAAAKLF